MTKVYFGQRQDLEAYKDADIENFTIDVYNNDNTNYDFTGATGFVMSFYPTQEREEVLKSGGNISASGNRVTVNVDYKDVINLPVGEYWYDIKFTTSGNYDHVILFGKFTVR